MNKKIKLNIEVDTEYSMTCISKMSQLIKTLSEKNEELYIQNKKLLSILESSSYTIKNE